MTQNQTKVVEINRKLELDESFWRGYMAGMRRMSADGLCGDFVPKSNLTIKQVFEQEIQPEIDRIQAIYQPNK